MVGPHTNPDSEEESATSVDMFGGRPYAITSGRTTPSTPLDMMSLVRATGRGAIAPQNLNYAHAEALNLCHAPVSVAEVAAQLGRSLTVTKILLSDLIETDVIIAKFPPPSTTFTNDPTILEAVIDGLRRLP